MIRQSLDFISRRAIFICLSLLVLACSAYPGEEVHSVKSDLPIILSPTDPVDLLVKVESVGVQRLAMDVVNRGEYATLTLLSDNQIMVDSLNIPTKGAHRLSALVRFDEVGDIYIRAMARDAEILLQEISVENVSNVEIPRFRDASSVVGIDKVSSIKYGGPTVADIDMDGDYDFIVNNHNAETSKLYWNNGDGTVTKHDMNLSRWFMHDLHGTALGDYDRDGDLDLVVTQGGGNGTDPSKANFYHNENGTLVRMTGDVGIDRGGRGRGASWSDMDMDGDLDLILFNETSLSNSKPQHFFYDNLGDGTFAYRAVKELEDQHPSRLHLTDFNSDGIDDVVLFGPMSLWQGNGDFTFKNVTDQLPGKVSQLDHVMAVADLDIDGDGDLDLYLARGKEFGLGAAPSLDLDPIKQELSIKPRGLEGTDRFDFTAEGSLHFHNYYSLAQGPYRGLDYPIFLGADKTRRDLQSGDEMDIDPDEAKGWSDDLSQNGVYFGHMGEGRWKAALVRGGDVFWNFNFSLSGVTTVDPEFIPENRNVPDVLLRNDGGQFIDVSEAWNIPKGGNSLGVTTGDINNDGREDIFVYRWGYIGSRISDFLLLNTGTSFELTTQHGAADIGGPGNGDMGQLFDFDLDGDLDLLSGSEGGEWYLYENEGAGKSHNILVRVGYSPVEHIDPYSAQVTVTTPSGEIRRRVGSAGSIFSQSLLNIVHLGLGEESEVEEINVRWRNGETVSFASKRAGQIYDTDRLDVSAIKLTTDISEIREGTSIRLEAALEPRQADPNLNWGTSDPGVLTVDDDGRLTARGKPGDEALITVESLSSGLKDHRRIAIVDWYEIPASSIALSQTDAQLYIGETLDVDAVIRPAIADNSGIVWESLHTDIARMKLAGTLEGLSSGVATIRASSAESPGIYDEMHVFVEPRIDPFIRIRGADKIAAGSFAVGDEILLNVDYHAGSGNRVISSDEGGLRVWFRHFKSEWIPEKDLIYTDAAVLGTESGSTSMTIPLTGLTPTSDLPDGHFYYIRASFAASDGQLHQQGIYPIDIVRADESSERE